MAVDKEKILDALKRHYIGEHTEEKKAEAIAEAYLKKIFNITMKIPEIQSEFYKDHAMSDDEQKCLQIRENLFFRFVEKVWIEWFGVGLLVVLMFVYSPLLVKMLDETSAQISAFIKYKETNKTKEPDIVPKSIDDNKTETNTSPTMPEKKVSPSIDGSKEAFKGVFYIPPHIEKTPWYSSVVLWISTLIMSLFFGIVVLLSRKNKAKKEQEIEEIWSYINTRTSLNPRDRNIYFNRINFFLSLGKKRYITNVTMGNITKTLRRSVLSMVFMFIFFFVVKSRKHTISRRLMQRITKAFSLAFEMEETTDSVKDGIDQLRKYDTQEYEGKNSRFDVIGHEDIVFL